MKIKGLFEKITIVTSNVDLTKLYLSNTLWHLIRNPINNYN